MITRYYDVLKCDLITLGIQETFWHKLNLYFHELLFEADGRSEEYVPAIQRFLTTENGFLQTHYQLYTHKIFGIFTKANGEDD